MRFDYALDAFIINQQLRGNTERTICGYQGFLRRFIDWVTKNGAISLDALEIHHIQKYQLYIDRKPSQRTACSRLSKRSIQTYMRHIRVFLAFCHTEGFIAVPLHTMLTLPKSERPMIEILTADEISCILALFSRSEIGLRNQAMVYLLLDCGLRLSELVAIQTRNVNFEKGYVKVIGKGRKERIVPIGLKVRRAILAYIHKRRQADYSYEDKYLFLSRNRRPLTPWCVTSLMARLKKRTGIARLHTHLFRHTFATNFLVHQIGDVYELSRILGHSEIRVTEMYLQLASYYAIIEKKRRISYLDSVFG